MRIAQHHQLTGGLHDGATIDHGSQATPRPLRAYSQTASAESHSITRRSCGACGLLDEVVLHQPAERERAAVGEVGERRLAVQGMLRPALGVRPRDEHQPVLGDGQVRILAPAQAHRQHRRW